MQEQIVLSTLNVLFKSSSDALEVLNKNLKMCFKVFLTSSIIVIAFPNIKNCIFFLIIVKV